MKVFRFVNVLVSLAATPKSANLISPPVRCSTDGKRSPKMNSLPTLCQQNVPALDVSVDNSF